MIWGKLIGGFLGYLVARFPGAIVGIIIGHFFDKNLSRNDLSREQVQQAFFRLTFNIMGHIAKSDGRVSEVEIEAAERMMRALNLKQQARSEAIQYFTQGKYASFDLDAALAELSRTLKGRFLLMNMFIEIQLQAAYADGFLNDIKKAKLIYVCEKLGFNRLAFARLNAMHQAEEKFRESQHQYYHQQYQKIKAGAPAVSQAYDLLGVASTDSDAVVKRAYRKLMSEHHPDKLIAKGLPEEMIRLATEKTQEIKAAYELIEKTRSIR